MLNSWQLYIIHYTVIIFSFLLELTMMTFYGPQSRCSALKEVRETGRADGDWWVITALKRWVSRDAVPQRPASLLQPWWLAVSEWLVISLSPQHHQSPLSSPLNWRQHPFTMEEGEGLYCNTVATSKWQLKDAVSYVALVRPPLANVLTRYLATNGKCLKIQMEPSIRLLLERGKR